MLDKVFDRNQNIHLPKKNKQKKKTVEQTSSNVGAKRCNIENEYMKRICFMFFFSQLLRLRK